MRICVFALEGLVESRRKTGGRVPPLPAVVGIISLTTACASKITSPPAHDFPTHPGVERVINKALRRIGRKLATLASRGGLIGGRALHWKKAGLMAVGLCPPSDRISCQSRYLYRDALRGCRTYKHRISNRPDCALSWGGTYTRYRALP